MYGLQEEGIVGIMIVHQYMYDTNEGDSSGYKIRPISTKSC